MLHDVLAKNAAFEDFEVAANFPALGQRTLVLNARQVHDSRARLLLLAFGDVTERRHAEREREELLQREQDARQEAETANRATSDFRAMVSHELRTPLNLLLGWIWRLRSGTLGEVTRMRAIESLDRNVNLQAKFIEDLLDVSRIERGAFQVDMSGRRPYHGHTGGARAGKRTSSNPSTQTNSRPSSPRSFRPRPRS